MSGKDPNLKELIQQLTRELRESEARFHNIVSISADGIVIVNDVGEILFVNQAAISLFGRKMEELLGEPFGFPIVGGETTVLDIATREGKRIIAEMRVVATEWEQKPAYLATLHDITERKHAENEREKARKELEATKISEDEAREYAESIINTVREPLIVLDQDLRVVSASRSFYGVFKVVAKETVGQLIYDLGNKQWNIPKLRELLEDILPQKTTFAHYEVEHEFSTIGRRIMLLNARQIKRVLGKERIILLAIEDITERRRLEDLLTDSEERHRRIFENANDGIVLLEKSEGLITHVNPSAEKMLCRSKEECIGKNLQDLGVSLDMSDFPSIMRTLDNCGIINYHDVPIKTTSGQLIYADIYMVEGAKLAQCNIRETTERKKAEESLLQRTAELGTVNRELEAFIYSVSHDLRAPLRHISGFSAILMKDIAGKLDEKEKEYLALMHDGAEKMSRLIDDLLKLSKISRQDIQRREVNLSVIAASIVNELHEAHPGRSVQVDIKEGLTAMADPGLIEIVLSNLLRNAWKFTAKTEHARIELGLVEKDGKMIYYVADNGAGFDQKFAEKMFWPFHRLHSEAEFEGTGIGLAIVDRIISRHGGKIWAEGMEGKGATIYFSLT